MQRLALAAALTRHLVNEILETSLDAYQERTQSNLGEKGDKYIAKVEICILKCMSMHIQVLILYMIPLFIKELVFTFGNLQVKIDYI